MSLNRSAIRPLAEGRPADVRRQRAERRLGGPSAQRVDAVEPQTIFAPPEWANPPSHRCQFGVPVHREGVAAVSVARLFNGIAATFKNFDLSVQSAAPVRSLLFASHLRRSPPR
jgi:hypothetical protein